MLIDFVPTVGGVSLAEAPGFKKAPGGAPANVAVGISRLGGSSAFIGKVLLTPVFLCLHCMPIIGVIFSFFSTLFCLGSSIRERTL